MPKSALEKAMDYLALRPLSAFELRSKLSKSGHFSAEEVENALETCQKRGYLNDELLASDAAQFLNSSGKGARLIRQKLRSRGIGEEELSQAMEQLSTEDEYESARGAAEGKLRLLTREKDMRKKKEKLFRFLITRGFSPSVAGEVSRELLQNSEEECFTDFPEPAEGEESE